MTDGNRILLGQFGAAHGIRGEIRVNAYTQDPLGIADYGPLMLEDGRTLTLLGVRMQGDNVIARVKGVVDRNAAEALTNQRLYVDRSLLPELDDEDDFYHADLVDLRAELGDGTPFGRVVAVANFGAGDLLEIEPAAGGRSLYLPFTRDVVPLVDIAGGRVVVAPPPEIEVREEDAAGETDA